MERTDQVQGAAAWATYEKDEPGLGCRCLGHLQKRRTRFGAGNHEYMPARCCGRCRPAGMHFGASAFTSGRLSKGRPTPANNACACAATWALCTTNAAEVEHILDVMPEQEQHTYSLRSAWSFRLLHTKSVGQSVRHEQTCCVIYKHVHRKHPSITPNMAATPPQRCGERRAARERERLGSLHTGIGLSMSPRRAAGAVTAHSPKLTLGSYILSCYHK